MINNLFWPVLIFFVICRLLWALFITICIFFRELCIKGFNLLFNNRDNPDEDNKQFLSPCKVSDSAVKEQLKKEVICKSVEPIKEIVKNKHCLICGKKDISWIYLESHNGLCGKCFGERPRCKCGKELTFYVEVDTNGKEKGEGSYRCRYCESIRNQGYEGPIEDDPFGSEGAAEGLEYGRTDDNDEQIGNDGE